MQISKIRIATTIAFSAWALMSNISFAVNPTPALIALCPDCPRSLRVFGTVIVQVPAAPIHVNSEDPCAVRATGTPSVKAPALQVNPDGGVCSTPGVTLPDIVDAEPIPDPLASLAPPTWDAADDMGAVIVSIGDFVEPVPGFYSGGIAANGGTCILTGGTYILGGVGLDIGGLSTFIAEEVTLYITGAGTVDIAGAGLIKITPQRSGPFAGVSIFQARPPGGVFDEAGGCGDSRIIGTGVTDLHRTRTLYFPCALLEIGGTSLGLGDQVIAWNISIFGVGVVTIGCEPIGRAVDIRPGVCPNPFNRKSGGFLPVAVPGSADLNVNQIDGSSIRVSRADCVGGEVAPNEGPPGPHSVLEDIATPFGGEACDCHELAGDGIEDWLMKFKVQDLVETLELDGVPKGAFIELVITGSLLDGSCFKANDCVLIVR